MWDVIARGAGLTQDHHPVRDMPACEWKGTHTYKLLAIEGEMRIEICKYGCGAKRKFPVAGNSTQCVEITEEENEALGAGGLK